MQGVDIKIKLNEKDFDSIKAGREMPVEEAKSWVKRVVVGDISKSDLDEERLSETNSVDMF